MKEGILKFDIGSLLVDEHYAKKLFKVDEDLARAFDSTFTIWSGVKIGRMAIMGYGTRRRISREEKKYSNQGLKEIKQECLLSLFKTLIEKFDLEDKDLILQTKNVQKIS